MVLDLAKKTYLLVTGASRGIGQTMATAVAAKLKPDSVIVLLARSEPGLAKTKSDIEALDKSLHVCTFSIDLSAATAPQFKQLIEDSLRGRSAKDFERAFIIHNAGSVGDVTRRAVDVSDTAIWTDYYHMNVFSTISLNCEFVSAFVRVPKLVVNITSLCGIEPFVSMSFYCSGKAAREMYFRVLATETAEADLLVLNYAPGAIDTDMTMLLQNESINVELARSFKEQRAQKTMLTTAQTTEKFLKVLQEQKFKTGAHVDYWDE